MKVCELKLRIGELKSNIELLKYPKEIIEFVSRRTEMVALLEDEGDVHPGIMLPVKELINQFWHWVVGNVPYDEWNNGADVRPWLFFQQSLVKANVLEADFHHSILYEELKNNFDHLAGNRLMITELMPLFIRASRMLGYKERSENDYPLLRLNAGTTSEKPQVIVKMKDVLFLLRTLYYLIYKYCTVEQLTLIPFLIHFRSHTTDEERRSELAIFNWLTQNTDECIKFFNTHNQYIDTRSIKFLEDLRKVTHLIPTLRVDFLSATDQSRWIYPFIQQVRFNPGDTEDELIEKTFHLLELDFATRKEKSLAAGLSFASEVNRQARILTSQEASVVYLATCLFCLEEYKKNRQKDSRDKYSLWSFSAETRCQAAEKRKLAILGKPVKFGFFESLAINQGQLKKVVDFLDDNQALDSEEYTSYLSK
ncbi:hypothetical protein DGG96_01135 [Legionella qingyii]|uniref:Uncharacterized protein n=1 Tax=Legionella qingyii TaxID=2184757 RepID=A0A317U7Z5_9GAMM|nr:hypothetical protein [Legionella qingyii]PWY57026.1 hypothetical protein DGG96_03290 [Legionella qingyii]PWY57353.1 hypothetical protein DGG96_01135 [Legionella qingyii]RUR26442.1 hypothetical protein ELY20_00540 [Legionella qingyii]